MYEYIDNFLYSCKKRQRHQNCKWKLTHTHTSIHRCIFIPLHVYITHARIELQPDMAAQWAAKIVTVQLLCCTYFLFFSAVVAHKVTRLSHVKSHSTCSYCFCLSHNIGPALSGMKPWPKRVASSNFDSQNHQDLPQRLRCQLRLHHHGPQKRQQLWLQP